MQTFIFKDVEDQLQELARFAEALGASFNQENGIIYKGSNNQMGFKVFLDKDSDSLILNVSLTGFSDSAAMLQLDCNNGINYEVSGASIVFGGNVRNSSEIQTAAQCAAVPYNSQSAGGYAYILGYRGH